MPNDRRRTTVCPYCNGTGYVIVHYCETCQGCGPVMFYEFSYNPDCPDCHGGYENTAHDRTCPQCNGEGYVMREAEVRWPKK